MKTDHRRRGAADFFAEKFLKLPPDHEDNAAKIRLQRILDRVIQNRFTRGTDGIEIASTRWRS